MSSPLARFAVPLAIVGLTMLLGHVVASADPSSAPAPAASPAASPAAETGKPVEVNTYHFAYTPNPVTVAIGTKVTFKNSDGVAHTVTSEDGGDKPAFDSGDMPQNATWSHIFAKAGTYNYYCAYHPYMKATVVVK